MELLSQLEETPQANQNPENLFWIPEGRKNCGAEPDLGSFRLNPLPGWEGGAQGWLGPFSEANSLPHFRGPSSEFVVWMTPIIGVPSAFDGRTASSRPQ
jgi:hypothetical protein